MLTAVARNAGSRETEWSPYPGLKPGAILCRPLRGLRILGRKLVLFHSESWDARHSAAFVPSMLGQRRLA